MTKPEVTNKQLDEIVGRIIDCFEWDPVLETIVGDGSKAREILRAAVEEERES